MRNLKKSFALILSMVMVLGLCTIGAGAAFGDQDAIVEDYVPAVEVMSGMGILKGDDNDNDGVYDFRPIDPVTRAEAAKMITYMILGEAAAEKLPAKAVLDVPETAWESKYVSYLYNAGIINGMGDGTFNSKGQVTANQYAKMLLCACGYGQDGEYVGKGWDVNVFVDAIDTIYADAVVADFSAPATRQEAALYTFAAMTKIVRVRYSENNGYTEISGSTFAKYKYNYAEMSGIVTATADTNDDGYAVIDSKDFVSDIAKELIGHKVKVYYNSKADKNGAYEVYAIDDLSEEVSVNTTIKALAKAIGSDYSDEYIYWVNYAEATPVINKDINWKALAETKGSKNAYDSTADTNPNGIYIYDASAKEIIGYKTASYSVGQVTKIGRDGEVTIKLYTSATPENPTYAKDEISAYDGIAKGDWIVGIKSGANIVVEKLDLVSGVKVTRFAASKGMINNQYEIKPNLTYTPAIKSGNTYDLYVDANGNWAYAEFKNTDISNWMLLTAVTYDKDEDSYYAEGADSEGKVVSYRLEDEDAATALKAQLDAATGLKRFIYSVSTAKKDAERNTYYVVKRYDNGISGISEANLAFSLPSKISEAVVMNDGTTPAAAGDAYYLTSDTAFYTVYWSKSEGTVVTPASNFSMSMYYPTTIVTSGESIGSGRYNVDYAFINVSDKIFRTTLQDDYSVSLYSDGSAKITAIYEDDDVTYAYIDKLYIDGELVEDVCLKFSDENEGAEAWFGKMGKVTKYSFAAGYAAGATYDVPTYGVSTPYGTFDYTYPVEIDAVVSMFEAGAYLQEGFYTYIYDADDDSYLLGYSDASGVYIQAFADDDAKYMYYGATGHTFMINNAEITGTLKDGSCLISYADEAGADYWAGQNSYSAVLENIIKPENYDGYIVDLTDNGIEYVDDIVALVDAGKTVKVSFHYWAYGNDFCSPLYITAVVD